MAKNKKTEPGKFKLGLETIMYSRAQHGLKQTLCLL
jgi:hypothetical protein